MNDKNRCDCCGSWEVQCASDTSIPGCGCLRCVLASFDAQNTKLERALLLKEQAEARVSELVQLVGEDTAKRIRDLKVLAGQYELELRMSKGKRDEELSRVYAQLLTARQRLAYVKTNILAQMSEGLDIEAPRGWMKAIYQVHDWLSWDPKEAPSFNPELVGE